MSKPSSANGADPLAGRRVLITGPTSGIGLVTARTLSERGARLALVSRNEEALDEVAESLPGETWVVPGDVTDPERLAVAVEEAVDRLGGLDVVVSNAGATAYGPFTEISPSDFDQTVATTFTGTVNLVRLCLPHLERSAGTVVVTGSVAGRVPMPLMSPYVAAKHALRGFTRTLSIELAAAKSEVTVSLVSPGPVDTPFWRHVRSTDGRRPPEPQAAYSPDDVADAIVQSILRPRGEVTVGGAMRAFTALYAVANPVIDPLLAMASRWGSRDSRPEDPEEGLRAPSKTPQADGGLATRPTLTGVARSVIGRVLP